MCVVGGKALQLICKADKRIDYIFKCANSHLKFLMSRKSEPLIYRGEGDGECDGELPK